MMPMANTMQIHRDPAAGSIVIERGTVVTIGAYDGVHRGHRALLRLVHDLGVARDLESAVVTFDKHPAEVVRPESAPKLLTSLDQKLELLGEFWGGLRIVPVPFPARIAATCVPWPFQPFVRAAWTADGTGSRLPLIAV